jgi:Glycosyltransferase 61
MLNCIFLYSTTGYSIKDFHSLLHRGLSSEADFRFNELEVPQKRAKAEPLISPSHCLNTSMSNITTNSTRNLKIIIFIRKKTRVLQNVKEVVKTCHRFGFSVQILNAKMGTPLGTIYEALESADVMLAVHGAAMTHFLMMRPGSLLIQIVPLGLDWAAENFYGEPARRLGLGYMEYKVTTEESSLSKDYEPDNPVLVDPSVVTKKGWWEMKKVYMDNQNVKVDVKRFGRLLQEVQVHVMQSRCIRQTTGEAKA